MEHVNSGSDDAGEEITASEYIRAVTLQLQQGKKRVAYDLVRQAVVKHEHNALLLSYYGYLQAVLEGKYRSGIEACSNALSLFRKQSARGVVTDGELNALLHFNLGRAYLSSGKRKEAIDTFRAGLRHDRQNRNILTQLNSMGARRNIPLNFLARSNPLNKYIGFLLNKVS